MSVSQLSHTVTKLNSGIKRDPVQGPLQSISVGNSISMQYMKHD